MSDGSAKRSGPDPETAGEITELLDAYASGAPEAFDRLLPLVYADLKRVAHNQLGSKRRVGLFSETLQTTELVHEAWFKLSGGQTVDWKNRGHFFAIAARAMRQVVADHARSRKAIKRGSDWHREPLDEAKVAVEASCDAVLRLIDVLKSLEDTHPRLARVVDCRFFAGLTLTETAEALSVSEKTVQRDWLHARVLLREMMGATADVLARSESAT